MQDVLLSVHMVRATYDPARPFVPWLLAIVRNRLVDGARRYARIARRVNHVDDDDVTFSRPQRMTISGAGRCVALLRRGVALPAGQRQAIEFLKLRELSLERGVDLSGPAWVRSKSPRVYGRWRRCVARSAANDHDEDRRFHRAARKRGHTCRAISAAVAACSDLVGGRRRLPRRPGHDDDLVRRHNANNDVWRFLLPQIAAIAVSAAAATAAFASMVPGASSRVLFWPLVVLALWIGVLFTGSVPRSGSGLALPASLSNVSGSASP